MASAWRGGDGDLQIVSVSMSVSMSVSLAAQFKLCRRVPVLIWLARDVTVVHRLAAVA